MAVVSSEQIINVDDPTAKFLEEGLPDENLAETSKLEQEKTNYIESLDDLFGHVKYATVEEFPLEFLNFDVLNYVDLGLDSLLDDSITDVVESNTGGQVNILNESDSMANDGNYDFSIESHSETTLEVQLTMTVPDTKLDSLKSPGHQQQLMHEQLNSFNAVEEIKEHQKKQEVDEVSMIEICTQVQPKSVENGNVTAENLAPVRDSVAEEIENDMLEDALKCDQEKVGLECDRWNVNTSSEKVELDKEMSRRHYNSNQLTAPLRKSQRCSKPNSKYINDSNGKKPTGKGKKPTGKGKNPTGKGKNPTGKGKNPTGKGKKLTGKNCFFL